MQCIEGSKHQMFFGEQCCYDPRLLEPGYAGELHPDEFKYVKFELKRSASLRRKWGFRPSANRLSEKHIREVARNGLFKNKRSVLASFAVKKKQLRWKRSNQSNSCF
jgi:hypothetical protein